MFFNPNMNESQAADALEYVMIRHQLNGTQQFKTQLVEYSQGKHSALTSEEIRDKCIKWKWEDE